MLPLDVVLIFVLFVFNSDSGVSFATQKGIVASRSKVYWFKHNDIEDLEKCMLDQQERDKKVFNSSVNDSIERGR